VEKISTLIHTIYKVVYKDSVDMGEDFLKLLSRLNVRKTFNLSAKELWVMQHLGGREFIAKIHYEEPNHLNSKILEAIQKYDMLQKSSDSLYIAQ